MELEVCIDSVEGALVASKYGAKRVELCAALSEGGLTPSAGLIQAVCAVSTAEVFVMIRPSAGGFNYKEDELLIMKQDIKIAKELGATGVVFGVLTQQNEVDVQKNLFLIEKAIQHKLSTTFHRAIDLCPSPSEALEHLIHLGFDRVLTSGSKSTAIEGLDTILKLTEAASNSIEIMAGSGINVNNCQTFLKKGIHAIHCTAKTVLNEGLPLNMGPKYSVDEMKIKTISELISK